MYAPEEAPSDGDMQNLIRYLQSELNRISDAFNAVADGRALAVRTVAPDKAATGQIVYADGTLWNPGAGEGMYERRVAGTWNKL